MATIEQALEIAARAHAGQTDRQGVPYILHPLRVMHAVHGLDAQIVAVLHDVVEDTPTTLDDLRAAGFNETIVAAVDSVTHREGEPYAAYVIRAKANPVGRQVKLADLQDNSRIDRTLLRAERQERDVKRMQRYVLSYQFLSDQITEEHYTATMKPLE